jgi:NAD(P)-dependent dehydrogenase (short-subunit alcohol dehydrogenase family)
LGRLNGKVALITGAGSGQGRAAAQLFAQEGAAVVANDIIADSVAETVKLIETSGGRCAGVIGDVASPDDVDRMVREAIQRFGRLDCLYNNAAINVPNDGDGPILELRLDTWDRVLQVNLRGVMLACRAAIPHMLAQGSGSIINVSSVVALVGGGAHAYSAAKGGVISLTRAISVTYSPAIRANVLCPGSVRTRQTDVTLADPKKRAYWLSNTPLGRIAEPSEIAPLALYLASDEAAFVTGSVFVIDGGFTAH